MKQLLIFLLPSSVGSADILKKKKKLLYDRAGNAGDKFMEQ
jgi:hypothetical protein